MTVEKAVNTLLELLHKGVIKPTDELGFYDYFMGTEVFQSPEDFVIEQDNYGNKIITL